MYISVDVPVSWWQWKTSSCILRSISTRGPWLLEHVLNMAHALKPDFVFQRNGRVHLNWQGSQFSRLLAAEVCASAVVMLDTPCSEVECKTTGYPLHSHVSPSLPLPCVTVCHQVSTELYQHTGVASGQQGGDLGQSRKLCLSTFTKMLYVRFHNHKFR